MILVKLYGYNQQMSFEHVVQRNCQTRSFPLLLLLL